MEKNKNNDIELISLTLLFPFPRLIDEKLPSEIKLQTKTKTVEGLFKELSTKFGEKFKRLFFDKKGNWKPVVNIFVNGTNISQLEGKDTKLKFGDKIMVVYPLTGG